MKAINRGCIGWQDAQRFLDELPERQRRLLAQKGSLTEMLEEIFDSKVQVELKSTGKTRKVPCFLIDGNWVDLYSRLHADPMDGFFEREVWLRVDGKRLVYARSLFPLRSTPKGFIDILMASDKPISVILSHMGISFVKSDFEIIVIEDSRVSEGFGGVGGIPLFARRYVLQSKRDYCGHRIRGVILEVFNPEVISVG